MNYKRVRKNFTDGLWTEAMVRKAYAVGIITKEEYKEIVSLPRDGGEDGDTMSQLAAQLREANMALDIIEGAVE
jgi:hypothetical protein